MSFGLNLGDAFHHAVNFADGFANAWGSDDLLGAGRQDQNTTAGKIGAGFGDAAATIQGLLETDAGIGGEVGGVALDATGVGALVGVPVNILSAGLIAHGIATSLTGVSHLAMAAAQNTPHGADGTPARASNPKRPNQDQWVTKPTGEPGGTPTGTRSTNKPNASPAFKRGIELENQSADILAEAGYKVEQNPKVPGAKNPDYRIEGQVFDCYSPRAGTDARGIVDAMNKKVGSGQTERIVLNTTDDSGVTKGQILDAIREYGSPDLKEIIMIDKNQTITHLYPG